MLINNSNFLINEIPNYNPVTEESKRFEWWKTQKRRCIEGYWSSGKWMPGELYNYVNFYSIEVAPAKGKRGGTAKITGRPWLRDLEWKKAYIACEAFGFSGFTEDDKYTCNNLFIPEDIEKNIRRGYITEQEAVLRIYKNPREYLNSHHGTNLGKPMFENSAKNIVDLESRGGGKSFLASNYIFCNFHYDGAFDYDIYLEKKEENQPLKAQTLVGAFDAKYSSDLLKKYLFSVKHLPGSYVFQNKLYPSPLTIDVSGNLSLSADAIPMVSTSSGSLLFHRTWNTNINAGSGTRANRVFIEEVGIFKYLTEVLGALKDSTMDSQKKIGTIWMFGTGGFIKSGVLDVKKVFYNPDVYDCLAFEDEIEKKGKIGLFISILEASNDFKKGPNLETDFELAKEVIEEVRAKLKSGKDDTPYNAEVVNRPIKPSEMFASAGENNFPKKYIEIAEDRLNTNPLLLNSFWVGFYIPQEGGGVKWKTSSLIPFREWGINPTHEGVIEVFEQPKASYTNRPVRYIASADVVDDDDVQGSLQSMFVFDLYTERIVAEYTGRTKDVTEWYENARLLLIAFNALCNYENNKKGFYAHMKNKNSLHLLCDTPSILFDKDLTKTTGEGNKSKGTYATAAVNSYGRAAYNTWLRKQAIGQEEGIVNAMILPSLGLCDETKMYSPEGNFDRMSSVEKLFILYEDFMYLYNPEFNKKTETETDKLNKELDIYEKWLKQQKDNNVNSNNSQNSKAFTQWR